MARCSFLNASSFQKTDGGCCSFSVKNFLSRAPLRLKVPSNKFLSGGFR